VWRFPDGAWRGVAILAGILASVGAGSRLLHKDDVLPVKRGDLVQPVDVEGELRAVHAVEISPPSVTEVEFKISFMVPEGAAVKKGDPILGFDTQALQKMLDDKKAERDEARQKLAQKQRDLEVKRLALDDQIGKAEATLRKARLKAEVPADLVARIEAQKARLEETGSERDLDNLRAERAVLLSTGDAESRSLESESTRAEGRVAALEASMEKMMVKAPQDGVVIYRTSWRDEKKKVGDTVWMVETVLSLADLSEMDALGDVDEADAGQLAPGQKVTLRLEARPDVDLRGSIRSIGRTVRRKSWRLPTKVYRVEIALEKTDPTFMRPSMRFRGEIESTRVGGLLLVPREAVFLRPTGPVAWVKRTLGFAETKVELGRGNRTFIEVRSGLRDGDLVSPADLALADAPPPSSAAP
jgi:HlyD family secretion protein